jgi:peptidoglycan/LPS O-acetylase OafA/YrhL
VAHTGQYDHSVAGEESPQQRVNRELIELLNEVRVAIPGVQVLFAFLLAVPFQQRFKQATVFQRDTYFATLSCAFVATALLVAPSALHRLNFRQGEKQQILTTSNNLIIAGIAVLGVALVGVILLVADVLFVPAVAAIAPAIGAAVLIMLWGVLPWRIRRAEKRSQSAEPSSSPTSERGP